MHLSSKHKRNIYRILPFGFLWATFGIIYSLLEKGLLGDFDYYPSTGNSYDFTSSLFITTILATVTGLILGVVEILFLSRYFSQRSFGTKLIVKTCLYITSICIILIIITFTLNASRAGLPFYNPEVIDAVYSFFNNFAFWSMVIYIGAIMIITLFISEVSDNLGQGILINFLV